MISYFQAIYSDVLLYNTTLALLGAMIAWYLVDLVVSLAQAVRVQLRWDDDALSFAADFYLNRDQHRTDVRWEMRKRLRARKRVRV